MKKFLIFIFLLIVGFVVVNIIYLLVLGYIDWDFGKTKEASNFKNQNYNVLVFGNSTALDGVNTEMLTKSIGQSYNFAVGGASLESNFIQFENYLFSNQKPEKVLLFLSSCHINYEKIQEVNPIIEYFYTDSFGGKLSDVPLFRFRWLFIENLKKVLSSDHRNAKIVSGQLRISRSIPDSSTKNETSCPDNTRYIDEGYKFVNAFAAICKTNGIKFIVFEMPCWTKYQNACDDEVLKFESSTVPLFNLNRREVCDSILNPSTDWLSENHLNFNGSIKLTRQIESIVSEIK